MLVCFFAYADHFVGCFGAFWINCSDLSKILRIRPVQQLQARPIRQLMKQIEHSALNIYYRKPWQSPISWTKVRTGVIAHTYLHMCSSVCNICVCVLNWFACTAGHNPVLLAGSPMISVRSTRQLRDGFMNGRPRLVVVVLVVVAPHSPAQHKATIANRLSRIDEQTRPMGNQ